MKIKYIGKREQYLEGCYGSKILFIKGEVKNVETNLALKLLNHPDQFIEDEVIEGKDETSEKEDEVIEGKDETSEKEDEVVEERVQEVIDSLLTMDKDAMGDFVEQNFAGSTLDKRGSEETVRSKVTQLIHQYGVA